MGRGYLFCHFETYLKNRDASRWYNPIVSKSNGILQGVCFEFGYFIRFAMHGTQQFPGVIMINMEHWQKNTKNPKTTAEIL
jgi:hypothetical protein